VDTKGGEKVSPKGRPTDNPKILNTRIRLSEEDVKRLEFCAQKTGLTKSEIIRQGIKEVYERLKK
jgi:predicted DNA-binding protein